MTQHLRSAGMFGVLAALAALACGQAPLYYSNQNQYFLHGLALAGVDQLQGDWLAETEDPTPIFSLLVAATARVLDPVFFYGYYALLIGIYFASLLSLFRALAGERWSWQLDLFFIASCLILHAAVVRWASYRFLGQDYPWYFQSGVAGQYVLGAMFQPSTFGVLLVLSIALFMRNRPYAAVIVAAAGAAVHSTYLLPAGMLTIAYCFSRWRDGQT